MKNIAFSNHAKDQMVERGASAQEVIESIHKGDRFLAKHSRIAYRHNFQYNSRWGKNFYRIKQVMPVTKEEAKEIIVVTVYTFYF
ncbi:MAG: DUF4258 domain-containing protein [Elusimicrobia bacterium]|nr:DUF4258 domain-containing protein [Elusimicrobiota bacterium]